MSKRKKRKNKNHQFFETEKSKRKKFRNDIDIFIPKQYKLPDPIPITKQVESEMNNFEFDSYLEKIEDLALDKNTSKKDLDMLDTIYFMLDFITKKNIINKKQDHIIRQKLDDVLTQFN